MSWPSYPDVKLSGVEWLGEVPSHWTVDRIKWSVHSSQNGIWGAEPDGGPNDIRCVRVADFDRPRLAIQDRDVTYRNVSGPERRGRVLRKGDLILEKSGGGENNPVGFVVLYDRTDAAVTSNFVARVTLRPGMEPRFWTYLHSWLYNSRLTRRSLKQTSGIQNLDQQSYFDERVCFPPSPDQIAIADFLDRETAKIDALIAKQEQLVATLREDRTATITHAVTHGLNPHVMRPSGVEWVDQLPDHWLTIAIKKRFHVTVGKMLNSSTHSDAVDLRPYLRAANIQPFGLDIDEIAYMPLTEREQKLLTLKAGDLVVVEGGGGYGRSVCLKEDLDGWGFQNHVLRVRPREHDENRFLDYVIKTLLANGHISTFSNHATIPSVSSDTLGRMRIGLPPAKEQRQIIEFLDLRCGKIDGLIAKALEVIGTLREYRLALITDAVTGKIDVRGAA